MIEQLSVQDYILFEDALIDFNSGMSVITGETGAGKSLLIDAVHALSGARVNRNDVRRGKEKAVLQMVLSDPSEEVIAMMEENGYDASDEIVITRIIHANGKSRILVNNRVATNAFVSSLVSKLIDIHSQMDTIQLTNPDVQLEMLDRYAQNESLKEQTAQTYRRLHQVAVEIRKLKNEVFSKDALIELDQELDAIEKAAVKNGELESLEKQIEQAHAVEGNLEALKEAVYLWKSEQGIQEKLYGALAQVETIKTDENWSSEMSDLYYRLEDLFDRLDQAKSDLADGAENLDVLIGREQTIRRLFKKYGGSYESLQKAKADLSNKAERIIHRQDLMDRLEKEKKEALKAYTQAASALHKSRQNAVPSLKEKIESHARDLMLEHCRFDIRFAKKSPSKDGMDTIEFVSSMNPGQPEAPIRHAASGGELSRLMLALKVVFQAQNGIRTLVFDEIDTGVSGKVALAMGSKMHALAENYQVLCITHLPSVAVWADTHYRVAKSSDGETTVTQVQELDESAHFEELAIMANGSAEPSAVESMKKLAGQVRHG